MSLAGMGPVFPRFREGNMQTYLFPTSTELMEVDQNLGPVLEMQDPIFTHFPVKGHDAAMVIWEQEDDYTGLMQMRGYEAEFPAVSGTPVKRYSMDPGVYGEHDPISEIEITTRREFGSFSKPIETTDLVLRRHKKLATRHYNRMSWILWTLLATGVYIVTGPTGAVLKMDSYAPQPYASAVAWATAATSAPLADLRAVVLLARGSSVNFGADAVAYMTRKTLNYALANTNAADIGGRRTSGLATIEGQGELNTLLTKDDLPSIRVWDRGWKSDGVTTPTIAAGVFTTFIPDNVVIVIGKRDNGAAIGEFMLTRNASNPDVGWQPVVRVVDTGANENTPPPRLIKVYRGFNGGPAIFYPSAVVVMTV